MIKYIENSRQALHNNRKNGDINNGRESVNQGTGNEITSGNMESKIENTRQMGKDELKREYENFTKGAKESINLIKKD